MRRGNGEGSIFKLGGKRRKPWAVRVTVGFTPEGKQKYKYLSYHVTKTEAKAALREYLVNPYDLSVVKITFEDVYNEWLEKADLKQGTLNNHKSAFKKLSVLHNKPIKDITLKQIEDTLSPEKPTSQMNMKKTLRVCFKHALRRDYVTRDVTQYLETAKHTNVKEIKLFTIEEINELWENVGTEYFDDVPLLLLYTGLRISELLNIRTAHIDLENRYIQIAGTKTKNAVRMLPIHDKIFPLIEKRYNENNGYLIINRLTKQPFGHVDFSKKYWKLNHTRHEARHTFITYLTKCVQDPLTIKRIVGHSTKNITDHYTHRNIEELRQAINQLEYK